MRFLQGYGETIRLARLHLQDIDQQYIELVPKFIYSLKQSLRVSMAPNKVFGQAFGMWRRNVKVYFAEFQRYFIALTC